MNRFCLEYHPVSSLWVRRPLTLDEEAVRGLDHTRHQERLTREAEEAAKPKPLTLEERLVVAEAKIAALENPASSIKRA